MPRDDGFEVVTSPKKVVDGMYTNPLYDVLINSQVKPLSKEHIQYQFNGAVLQRLGISAGGVSLKTDSNSNNKYILIKLEDSTPGANLLDSEGNSESLERHLRIDQKYAVGTTKQRRGLSLAHYTESKVSARAHVYFDENGNIIRVSSNSNASVSDSLELKLSSQTTYLATKQARRILNSLIKERTERYSRAIDKSIELQKKLDGYKFEQQIEDDFIAYCNLAGEFTKAVAEINLYSFTEYDVRGEKILEYIDKLKKCRVNNKPAEGNEDSDNDSKIEEEGKRAKKQGKQRKVEQLNKQMDARRQELLNIIKGEYAKLNKELTPVKRLRFKEQILPFYLEFELIYNEPGKLTEDGKKIITAVGGIIKNAVPTAVNYFRGKCIEGDLAAVKEVYPYVVQHLPFNFYLEFMCQEVIIKNNSDHIDICNYFYECDNDKYLTCISVLPNIGYDDKCGVSFSPLFYAYVCENFEAFKMLLRHGIRVNDAFGSFVKSANICLPIVYAIVFNRSTEANKYVKLLLEKGQVIWTDPPLKQDLCPFGIDFISQDLERYLKGIALSKRQQQRTGSFPSATVHIKTELEKFYEMVTKQFMDPLDLAAAFTATPNGYQLVSTLVSSNSGGGNVITRLKDLILTISYLTSTATATGTSETLLEKAHPNYNKVNVFKSKDKINEHFDKVFNYSKSKNELCLLIAVEENDDVRVGLEKYYKELQDKVNDLGDSGARKVLTMLHNIFFKHGEALQDYSDKKFKNDGLKSLCNVYRYNRQIFYKAAFLSMLLMPNKLRDDEVTCRMIEAQCKRAESENNTDEKNKISRIKVILSNISKIVACVEGFELQGYRVVSQPCRLNYTDKASSKILDLLKDLKRLRKLFTEDGRVVMLEPINCASILPAFTSSVVGEQQLQRITDKFEAQLKAHPRGPYHPRYGGYR